MPKSYPSFMALKCYVLLIHHYSKSHFSQHYSSTALRRYFPISTWSSDSTSGRVWSPVDWELLECRGNLPLGLADLPRTLSGAERVKEGMKPRRKGVDPSSNGNYNRSPPSLMTNSNRCFHLWCLIHSAQLRTHIAKRTGSGNTTPHTPTCTQRSRRPGDTPQRQPGHTHKETLSP
jgi:hypothetical protein